MTKRRVAYIRDKVEGGGRSTKKKKGKKRTGKTQDLDKSAAAATAAATDTPETSPAEAAAQGALSVATTRAETSAGSSAAAAAEEEESADVLIAPELVDSLFVADEDDVKASGNSKVDGYVEPDDLEATDDDLMIGTAATLPADESASSLSDADEVDDDAGFVEDNFVTAAAGSAEADVDYEVQGSENGGARAGGGAVTECGESGGGGGKSRTELLEEIRSMKVKNRRSRTLVRIVRVRIAQVVPRLFLFDFR